MTGMLMLLLGCGAPAPSHADVLAAADAHDGATDHVVSECAGCMLGMAGDPAHAVTHDGYTLHFCSDTCKATFEKDPAAGVARLEGAVK